MLASPSRVWTEVIIVIKRVLEQLSVLDESRVRLKVTELRSIARHVLTISRVNTIMEEFLRRHANKCIRAVSNTNGYNKMDTRV